MAKQDQTIVAFDLREGKTKIMRVIAFTLSSYCIGMEGEIISAANWSGEDATGDIHSIALIDCYSRKRQISS